MEHTNGYINKQKKDDANALSRLVAPDWKRLEQSKFQHSVNKISLQYGTKTMVTDTVTHYITY